MRPVMRSRRLQWILWLLVGLFLSHAAQAAKLIVKLAALPADEKYVNDHLAVPAGLQAGKNYHVTLGIIINVKKSQAKTLKKQIDAFLKKIQNPKKTPFRFDVKEVSTWGAQHNQYCNANTVIMLPSNPQTFKSLNLQLNNFILPLRFSGVQLDPATVPPHYVPHITLKGPKNVSSATAVSNANQYLQGHSLYVRLYQYRISIQ